MTPVSAAGSAACWRGRPATGAAFPNSVRTCPAVALSEGGPSWSTKILSWARKKYPKVLDTFFGLVLLRALPVGQSRPFGCVVVLGQGSLKKRVKRVP